MKYLGKIQDNKDLVTKEYVDNMASSSGMTKAQILAMFYPVGSYYETSDLSFDPNTTWGGTWILELEGQVHVSAGSTYAISGATNNTSDGGSADAVIPYHRHSVSSVTSGITGGGHTHSPSTSGNAFMTYNQTTVSAGLGERIVNAGTGHNYKAPVVNSSSVDFAYNIYTSSETHTHNLPAHNTAYVGTSGNTTGANMQPYIAVNRWHRTA